MLAPSTVDRRQVVEAGGQAGVPGEEPLGLPERGRKLPLGFGVVRLLVRF